MVEDQSKGLALIHVHQQIEPDVHVVINNFFLVVIEDWV